mgnify:FL=1
MGMYLGFKGDELPDFTFAPADERTAGASTTAAADYRFFTQFVDTAGSGLPDVGHSDELAVIRNCRSSPDAEVRTAGRDGGRKWM